MYVSKHQNCSNSGSPVIEKIEKVICRNTRVANTGCLSQMLILLSISDPGSNKSNKRGGVKKLVVLSFFWSHKFYRIGIFFIEKIKVYPNLVGFDRAARPCAVRTRLFRLTYSKAGRCASPPPPLMRLIW